MTAEAKNGSGTERIIANGIKISVILTPEE